MTIKIPRLCTSITVTGTASVRVAITGSPYTLVIPEGVYWADPTYAAAAASSDAIELPSRLTYLIEQVFGSLSGAFIDYAAYGSDLAVYGLSFDSSDTMVFDFTHAGSTTPGKTALARLGADTLSASLVLDVDGWASIDGYLPSTNWSPLIGEAFDTDEPWDGFGDNQRSHDGHGYAFNMGDPLARKLVSIDGLTGTLTRQRSVYGDTSLERCFWKAAQAGEKIRYWRDINASNTYLTTAMTATTKSAVCKSVTGIASGDTVVVDGETTYVESVNTGTKTLTLFRPYPVAHAIYSPVSDDWVATYMLGDDGNVSMDGFRPKKRAYNQDRWGIEIPLLRTT